MRSSRSSLSGSSRDPIWTRVSRDPGNDYGEDSEGSNEILPLTSNPKKGLNVLSTAIFIAGEMAGSGVLALSRATVDAEWIGFILLVVFCINAGYGGSRLGACWAILEERYEDYRIPVRNPYSTIAYRAAGPWASKLVSGCIQFTLFGAGAVYLLLASQIIKDIMGNIFLTWSLCTWFLLIGFVLVPAMWLGSPKDFFIVGLGALLTTAVSCVLMFIQIMIDGMQNTIPVKRKIHGFHDFFLAFGTILFAFGGASTFPTIQNDMKEKDKFSKSIFIAFIAILALYLPVTLGGYFVYGELVTTNLILSLGHTPLVHVANVLMAIHLIFAFLIVINPVSQEIEEFFQVPHDFGVKRCIVRTGIMLTMIIVGETIPRFGKILSLVGGSTITLLTFVLPSIFYIKLCNQKKPEWIERKIPLHVQVYLWELIIIGILGGSAATYSAILEIFNPDSMTLPCYWRS